MNATQIGHVTGQGISAQKEPQVIEEFGRLNSAIERMGNLQGAYIERTATVRTSVPSGGMEKDSNKVPPPTIAPLAQVLKDLRFRVEALCDAMEHANNTLEL